MSCAQLFYIKFNATFKRGDSSRLRRHGHTFPLITRLSCGRLRYSYLFIFSSIKTNFSTRHKWLAWCHLAFIENNRKDKQLLVIVSESAEGILWIHQVRKMHSEYKYCVFECYSEQFSLLPERSVNLASQRQLQNVCRNGNELLDKPQLGYLQFIIRFNKIVNWSNWRWSSQRLQISRLPLWLNRWMLSKSKRVNTNRARAVILTFRWSGGLGPRWKHAEDPGDSRWRGDSANSCGIHKHEQGWGGAWGLLWESRGISGV